MGIAAFNQTLHVFQHPEFLQGPLLAVLMQCCSSPFLEVQQLALAALNGLAAVPEHLPAFSRVRRPDQLLSATSINLLLCHLYGKEQQSLAMSMNVGMEMQLVTISMRIPPAFCNFDYAVAEYTNC